MLVPWILLKIMNEQNSRVLEKFKNPEQGTGKVFKFQLNIIPKILSKKSKFFVNNRPKRHCKMHIILFSKTNLKIIKFIGTFFLKTYKKKI